MSASLPAALLETRVLLVALAALLWRIAHLQAVVVLVARRRVLATFLLLAHD
jgi:hypothetical protein